MIATSPDMTLQLIVELSPEPPILCCVLAFHSFCDILLILVVRWLVYHSVQQNARIYSQL